MQFSLSRMTSTKRHRSSLPPTTSNHRYTSWHPLRPHSIYPWTTPRQSHTTNAYFQRSSSRWEPPSSDLRIPTAILSKEYCYTSPAIATAQWASHSDPQQCTRTMHRASPTPTPHRKPPSPPKARERARPRSLHNAQSTAHCALRAARFSPAPPEKPLPPRHRAPATARSPAGSHAPGCSLRARLFVARRACLYIWQV